MGKVAVIGGGISGLTTAFYLKKAGIKVSIFEKDTPGGSIQSTELEGTTIDLGPNSLRDKTGDLVELVHELGLKDDFIEVSEAFKTRCIVRHGKLQYLKPSPLTLFTTPVLSIGGKLRAISEPFRKGISDGESEESVADFLTRRIGPEAVDYLVDPFFSGIYAGDIHSLSKHELLPKLAQFEAEHGSMMKGMRKASKQGKSHAKTSVFNFKKGLQTLTNALTNKLDDCLIPNEVTSIKKTENGYVLSWNGESEEFDKVIACIPAYNLATLLTDWDSETAAKLNSIQYSPILTTQLIFDKNQLAKTPEGFGFLVPRKEKLRILGAIWKSSIFPEMASANHVHFNVMSGGAHDTFKPEDVEQVEEEVINEFKQLMGFSISPKKVYSRYWEKAIPQFNIGYKAIRQQLDSFRNMNPNFTIGGNYVWGVAVPECISNAKIAAHDITTGKNS